MLLGEVSISRPHIVKGGSTPRLAWPIGCFSISNQKVPFEAYVEIYPVLRLSQGAWVAVFWLSSDLLHSQCGSCVQLSCEQLPDGGSACSVSVPFFDLGSLEVKCCTSWCWFPAYFHALEDTSYLFGFLFIFYHQCNSVMGALQEIRSVHFQTLGCRELCSLKNLVPVSSFRCLWRVEHSSDLLMIGEICKLFTPFLFPATFLAFAGAGHMPTIVLQEWYYMSSCWALEGLPPAMWEAWDRNL